MTHRDQVHGEGVLLVARHEDKAQLVHPGAVHASLEPVLADEVSVQVEGIVRDEAEGLVRDTWRGSRSLVEKRA